MVPPKKRVLNAHNQIVGIGSVPKLYNSVEVFCRVRPLPFNQAHASCVAVKDAMTVALTPPGQWIQLHKPGVRRAMEYIFKRALDSSATQTDVFCTVAQPLLENLLRGRNGLLFTYGVSGSGKTFTMTGDFGNRGIMPLCFESLFATIFDYQADKFVFKSDHLNGFEIQSEEEAALERMTEEKHDDVAYGRGVPRRMVEWNSDTPSVIPCELPLLQGLDEDNMFAVFVSYIEVYNNCVYDLLEHTPINKTWQSKIIRTDAVGNMYVHGNMEIEVKTAEEALAAFEYGQRRKTMGHTVLNTESSRSHSVFNIRLVQAPTDYQGKKIVRDKATITISQLSLVDLAGSERSTRTNNKGIRLRETGNINNSLMTLRTCLEYLRENQKATGGGPPKKIPYRDAKITHLFRRYFDGEGQVSMIVCINPHADDYDENTQVLKFAEMTQEVQTVRATPAKVNVEFMPGRRRAQQLTKNVAVKVQEVGGTGGGGGGGGGDTARMQPKSDNSEIVDNSLPLVELSSEELEGGDFEKLKIVLQKRIARKRAMNIELDERYAAFRERLGQMDLENKSLKLAYMRKCAKVVALEENVVEQSKSIFELRKELHKANTMISELQHDKCMDKENQELKPLNLPKSETAAKDSEAKHSDASQVQPIGNTPRAGLKNRNPIHRPTTSK